MRRFDTPVGPPGWVGMGAELLRIVDPTGRAIAWLAPGFGANCVGYAVRRDEPAPGQWRQIFHTGSPRALRAHPYDHGCAILGPESDGGGSAHRTLWRFVERDPTAATCSARCGSIRLDLTASLEDAALQLDLRVTNEGLEAAPLAPGLRLCFTAGLALDLSASNVRQVGLSSRDERPFRLTVSLVEGQGGTLRAVPLPGERIALEARYANPPGIEIAPGEQVRLAITVVPG